jgi:PAS domain-containing protein
MTELNRAQLCAWESSLQLACDALEDPRVGTARLQARLRGAMLGLREAVEALKRMAEARDLAQRRHAATWNHLECLVENLPVPYLLTTVVGEILAANPAAGVALNVASRVLVGRNLLVFLDDRESWLTALGEAAASGSPLRRVCSVRPRERVQQRVVASISAVALASGHAVQWFLTAETAGLLPQAGMGRASGRRHARAS